MGRRGKTENGKGEKMTSSSLMVFFVYVCVCVGTVVVVRWDLFSLVFW